MALFEKRQPTGGGWQRPPRFQRPSVIKSRLQRPAKSSPSPKSKAGYTRSEVRGLLKGSWKGSRLGQQQRIGLEKEVFPYPKYGSYLSEGDLKTALQELRKAESKAKTSAERESLRRRRKTLEEATGFEGKH